jgi:two-component system, OmpR family, KDP operon response regulator KdpE
VLNYTLSGKEQMVNLEKKKSVLVVDDQPKVLKFIEIDLKLRGFHVVTSSSGEQALELINSMKPDVVLLDMIMPGMDGFETLKKIRAFSNLPVIAFSASPGNQDPAMEAGANEFMHKPFDPDNMAQRINALIE